VSGRRAGLGDLQLKELSPAETAISDLAALSQGWPMCFTCAVQAVFRVMFMIAETGGVTMLLSSQYRYKGVARRIDANVVAVLL
jgi:hypothetical protein